MSIEIIAEVAQGYEGDSKLAELLALAAVRSDADAVKFQLVYADELAVPTYQYYDLFKSLEMEDKDWVAVVDIIRKAGKQVYFDTYGEISLAKALKLGADGVKVSTTDFYNQGLIDKAVSSFKKVFISIGGVSVDDLDELVKAYSNCSNITFMYGFQAEPTPIEENNMLKIPEYIKKYKNIPVGFMDHSKGDAEEAIYLPLMAASMGVSCIEKHISLDHILELEDFISALEPAKFKQFVRIIRIMENALGSGKLELTALEKEYKGIAGKVVVAKRTIDASSAITADDLVLKRVDTDGSPNCFRKMDDLIGKKLKNSIDVNQPIMGKDML